MAADLAARDREPVRLPDAIQPHGQIAILCLALVGWSSNWASPSEAKARVERLSQDRLRSLKDGKPRIAVGTVELSGTIRMA